MLFLTILLFVQQAVKPGDTIFVGQYLFTGSETTSVWLEVSFLSEVNFVLDNEKAVNLD
jgi:hypothetical protein